MGCLVRITEKRRPWGLAGRVEGIDEEENARRTWQREGESEREREREKERVRERERIERVEGPEGFCRKAPARFHGHRVYTPPLPRKEGYISHSNAPSPLQSLHLVLSPFVLRALLPTFRVPLPGILLCPFFSFLLSFGLSRVSFSASRRDATLRLRGISYVYPEDDDYDDDNDDDDDAAIASHLAHDFPTFRRNSTRSEFRPRDSRRLSAFFVASLTQLNRNFDAAFFDHLCPTR